MVGLPDDVDRIESTLKYQECRNQPVTEVETKSYCHRYLDKGMREPVALQQLA
jgi:hypothetical protein